MTKHRVLLWILIGVLAASGAVPALAAPAPKEKAPAVGPRAGAISALLPVATVTRGVGKAAVKNEAKKGEELYWNDLIQTAKGGRARITLADQSILSLGSQAELRIVKHDAKTQQTLLQMTYGRVRAEVSSITRDGGRFEVRTPTAVAGVIGTDFGTDSGVGTTTFVCISGAVSVANSDPSVPGSVQCSAGQTTTVAQGKAPTPPKPASQEQIQQLILDTTPANIGAMSPAAALPGATIDATITGTKLNGVNAVQITGSDVRATLNQGGTDTSLSVHLVVAANAQPGPRTITLSKQSGVGAATVFTVLSPPTTAQNTGGDPKKPFHDTLEQLRQTGDSSLQTIVATVQQLVDQATQGLTQANQNLSPQVDLTQANAGLNAQVTGVKNAVAQATTQIDQAAQAANSGFDTAYTNAYNALLQRNAAGTPDDTFNQAVNGAFQQANSALQQAILGAQNSVNSLVQSAGTQIGQISQTWSNTISTTAQTQQTGPTPNVNGTEKTVDVGAQMTLDAGNSKATSGTSIISTNWALCDASYKPSQFGVPLQGNPQGCNPIAGLTASGPEFTFPTCNLTPADYIARVVVTDSNQKQSAMDVKVHVLSGQYPDPAGVEQALAQAYSSLQLSQFMALFDSTNFPGYTALSENVRRTFPTLASMNINVVVSSASISCNTATVRASWDQNYAFTTAPSLINKQTEQLQHTMIRTPGKGWLIVDQHGDNGTVSGSATSLPGPTVTDQALPDIQVTALAIPSGVNANNALNVASGNASFVATVVNTGAADLTATMPVHFSIRDASNNEVASADQNITTPLVATTGSTQMTVSMAVPNLQPGTPLNFVATANPGCAIAEKNCDANDTETLPFLVGVPLPNLNVTGINISSGVAGNGVVVMIPGPQTFTATISNTGNLPLTAATTVHFSLRDASNKEVVGSDQSIPTPLNPNSTVNVAATINMPAVAAGTKYTLVATDNPGCTVQEITCGAKDSGAVNVAIGATSIKPGTLSLTATDQTTPTSTLSVTVNGPASLTLVLPTTGGVTLAGANGVRLAAISGNTLTQTIASAGTLTWTLLADFTTKPGNYTMQLADATGLLPNTSVPFTIIGQDNYVIDPASFSFNGKFAPFTGANAIQDGTSPSLSVVVRNKGNLGQSGTITVTFQCSGPLAGTNCQNPITASIAAPAPGQATTAVGTGNKFNLTPGTYTGTAALSTTLAQSSTADDSLTTSFDATDFTLAFQNAPTTTPTIIKGGTFTMSALLTQSGTTAFPMTITPAATGVTVSGPTTLTSGSAQNYTVATTFLSPTGSATLALSATNQGITHSTATQQFLVLPPFSLQTAPIMNQGGLSQPFTVQANTAGTISLTLPTGVSLDTSNSSCIANVTSATATVSTAGTLTWCLQANFSATTGPSTFPINMTGAAFTGTFAQTADYSVTGVSPLTQTAVPNLLASDVTPTAGALSVVANTAGTLTLTPPAGVSIVGSATQTATLGQTITWNLTANFSSLPGTQNGSIAMTGSAITGTYTANAQMIITGQANYVVVPNTFQFDGKTGPFTGTNALQVGTTNTASVNIQNIGNLSQSGSITVAFTCSPGAQCTTPNTTTIAAPAAGQTVPAQVSLGNLSLTPGTYTGTAALSTSLAQTQTVDDTQTTSFDVTDFTLGYQGAPGTPPTIVLGGSFTMTALLTENGTSPFAMNITPTATGVTVSGPTSITPNTPITGGNIGTGTYTVSTTFTSPLGTATLALGATNQGVQRNTPTQQFTVVPPFTQTAAPTMNQGGTSEPLTVQANTAGTLTLTLPSGITVDPSVSNTCTPTATSASTTLTGAQLVTWCLQSSFSTTAGPGNMILGMTSSSFTGTYSGPVSYNIVGQSPFVQSGSAPNVVASDGTTGAFVPVAVTANTAGTLTLTPPTGVVLSSGTPATQTASIGQTVTWQVQANFSSVPGPNTASVQMTGAALSTPYTANISLNVVGQSNYVFSGPITFVGNPGPYQGLGALQVGSSATAAVTVQNIGNFTQSGSITVALNCSGAGSCGPFSTTISAPAAGSSVTANIPLGATLALATGSYTGSATLNTSLSQSTTADDTSGPTSFDVSSFSLAFTNGSPNPILVIQGGQLNLNVAMTQLGTTPYSLSVNALAPAGFTPSPASFTLNSGASGVQGSSVQISLPTNFSSPLGTYVFRTTATNQGVLNSAQQQFTVEAPFTQTATPTLTSGGSSQAITVQANTAGTLSLPGAFPTGISFDSSGSCTAGAQTSPTATISGPQAVTWCLQASSSSTTGALTANISMTSANFTGTYTLPANFSVNGVPTYSITAADFSITNHTSPYSSANALQVGETAAAQVTVHNIGNVAPAGATVTVAINCTGPSTCTPSSTTASAPGVASFITVSLPQPVPTTTGTYSETVSITSSATQGSTAQNAIPAFNVDVMDFTLVFTNATTPITLVQGQAQNMTALLTETGTTTFPMTVVPTAIPNASIAMTNPFTSGTPQTVTFTPSTTAALGPVSLVITGINQGVSRSATQQFDIVTGFTQIAAPALTQGGSSGALTVTANATGSLTLSTPPTGITLDTTGACPSGGLSTLGTSVTAGQTVTWCLKADNTAATGTISLQLQNTNVTYTNNVSFTVGAAPNYVINTSDLQFVNHGSGPTFTGFNALQLGETVSLNVTIHNTGTVGPAGNITVHLTCTPPSGNTTTECQSSPPDVVVAAPGPGGSVIATFTGLQFNDPVGVAPGFTGTATITAKDLSNNPIAEQSTSDNTASTTFDITDFTMTQPAAPGQPQGGITPYQNILNSAGSATMVIAFTQTGTSGSYPLTLTYSGLANTTFPTSPTSLSTGTASGTPGSTGTVTVTPTTSTPTGVGNVIVTATSNYGVVKNFSIPVNVLALTLGLNGKGSTSGDIDLYLNDQNDPLTLQVGAAPTTISLKLSGTSFQGGNATLTPGVVTGVVDSTVSVPSVAAGDIFDWSLSATTQIVTATPVGISAAIPNTNPSESVYFTPGVWVKGVGVPDLALTGFTYNGVGPWISGQGADFTLTVTNNGGTPSAGGENISGTLTASGTFDLGCSVTSPPTGVPVIPANGSTTVTVHCVSPDLGNAAYSSTAPLAFKIDSDPAGDLNYSNNHVSGTIPFTNWHAAVSGNGSADGTPATLNIGPTGTTPATATIQMSLDAGTSGSTFTAATGVVSSGLSLSAPPSPSAVGSNWSETISTTNGGLQNGIYLAQVVMTMVDPVTSKITSTRQATIHVAVNNTNITSPTGRNITFSSSVGNTASNAPLQINGALSQNLTVQSNCTRCTAGGTYDFSVHDDPTTDTLVNSSSAPSLSGVAIGTPINLTVSAAQDASGNITTGLTSSYTVNATAAQLSRARGISPDTGGYPTPLYFQIGDFDVSVTGVNANSCGNVIPGGSPLALTISFNGSGGFNANGSFQLLDVNGAPVGSTPLTFGSTAGSLPYTNNPSSPFQTLNIQVSNTQATDGLQTYYLAVTITNGTSSATKYFPLYFDASTAQNYCGIVSAARGTTRVRGSWNRSLLGGGGAVLSAVRGRKPSPSGKGTPDVRVNSQDISFSPSLPKTGDTVQVRFRLTNVGDGDATGIPIALRVNGQIVATDTFDVRAGGSALGGLEWTATDLATRGPMVTGRRGMRTEADGGYAGGAVRPASLMVVIDPQHTMLQKSQLQKAASVAHFTVSPGSGDSNGATAAMAAAGSQRIILEMQDGSCIGLHLATGGTTSCGSADVEITVDDLAKGTYKLEALNGISDLGLNLTPSAVVSSARLAGVRYSSEMIGLAGHSYAVQLSGGRTGVLTLMSVRSPGQLDARTRAIFRQNATRVMRRLGGDSQAPSAPGEITGNEQRPVVYFELMLQGN